MKYQINKKILIFIILIILFSNNSISAKQKSIKKYGQTYTYDDSYQALYCGYEEDFFDDANIGDDDFEDCILVSKPPEKMEGTTKYIFTPKFYKFVNANGKGESVIPNLITTEGDPVLIYKEKWWKKLILCYSANEAHHALSLYTDSLSNTSEEGGWEFAGNECMSLYAEGISQKNLISYCPKLGKKYNKIYNLVLKYQKNKKASYMTQYKREVEELRYTCTQVSKKNDLDEACMENCLTLESEIYEIEKLLGVNDEGKCGFSGKLISWILNILRWIKYIIPVAVIILGSLDFIKATGSDKDDDMKKAQSKFIKRLVAAALIFLVPLLIEFILPKFGFDYNGCGIF